MRVLICSVDYCGAENVALGSSSSADKESGGYAKYGCPSHRYRGVCSNAVTIRRERLEAQLLAALEQRIPNSQFIEYTLQRFHDELQKRMKEIEHQATGLDDLRRVRQQLQVKAQRLADAVADAGHSPALLTKLGTIEAQIADVDLQIESHKPRDLSVTVSEVREFAYRSTLQIKELLRGDATKLKAVLA